VFRIKGRKNFGELVGLIAELNENRRQQAAGVLLACIPEVKIKQSARGESSLARVLDVIDDR